MCFVIGCFHLSIGVQTPRWLTSWEIVIFVLSTVFHSFEKNAAFFPIEQVKS